MLAGAKDPSLSKLSDPRLLVGPDYDGDAVSIGGVRQKIHNYSNLYGFLRNLFS
jgi:hypothetical protein